MKEKFLNYLSLLSVLGIVFSACTREEPVMDWKYVHETRYFIEEARMFFENLIVEADENGTLDLKSGLNPGKITPNWEEPYLYSNANYDYVLIDFVADYYYNVRETVIKDGEVVYRTFPVYQYLLVRKNKSDGDMGAAYVTLTPNRLYHIKHRKNVPDNFFRKENRGDYTGLLFFNDVITMALMTAEKYRDGSVVSGAYYEKAESLEEFVSRVEEYTVNYTYLRYKDIFTRSNGESGTSEPDNNNNGGDKNPPAPGFDSGNGTEENPIPVPPAEVTPPGSGGNGWSGSEYPFGGKDPDEWTGWSGGGGGSDTGNQTKDPKLLETCPDALKAIVSKLIEAFGDDLKVIKTKTSIIYTSVLLDNSNAYVGAGLLYDDLLFNSLVDVPLHLYDKLSALQQMLTLGHEFLHLALFEISRNAGSGTKLATSDLELLQALNGDGINDGHHKYLTTPERMDEYEKKLRKAFPGQSEEFYKYGKWTGLTQTEGYRNLSTSEKNNIHNYLYNNGL
ncbi:MAG: hypothetical protein LUF90_10190 [Rikenellaceae bacterium]|nr:hypothetical protein [Rikenellaceae bacterium]